MSIKLTASEKAWCRFCATNDVPLINPRAKPEDILHSPEKQAALVLFYNQLLNQPFKQRKAQMSQILKMNTWYKSNNGDMYYAIKHSSEGWASEDWPYQVCSTKSPERLSWYDGEYYCPNLTEARDILRGFLIIGPVSRHHDTLKDYPCAQEQT